MLRPDPCDFCLAMIKPGNVVYYFHNDHLGTPQVLTNDSGSVVWKATYAPFGEAVVSIQTVENPFRFPGQYYDQETGLHYNYFRYYNPTTGRYITPDPIGLEGGINLFAYVGGNPIRWTDIHGLKSILSIKYSEGAQFGLRFLFVDAYLNFGSQNYDFVTGQYTVNESYRLGLVSGKKVIFGIGAEREVCGKTQLPQVDEITGRIIPGTGVTSAQILSNTPWQWKGYPFEKLSLGEGDVELSLGPKLLFFGLDVSLNISELSNWIADYIWNNLRVKQNK